MLVRRDAGGDAPLAEAEESLSAVQTESVILQAYRECLEIPCDPACPLPEIPSTTSLSKPLERAVRGAPTGRLR